MAKHKKSRSGNTSSQRDADGRPSAATDSQPSRSKQPAATRRDLPLLVISGLLFASWLVLLLGIVLAG